MKSSLRRLSIAVFIAVHPFVTAQASSTCSAEWTYTANFRNHIVGIVTGVDSASAASRAAFQLPAVSASDVYFVTDSTVCTRAAAAFTAEVTRDRSTAGGSLWVLRVGPTRYIVFDHKQQSGEFLDHYIFDSSFNYLLTMTG